jgi:hypothetical protein
MSALKRQLALCLLFLTVAAVSAHDWSFLAGDLRRQFRLDEHRLILTHGERPPAQYRVLVPYLLDPPIRFFANYMPYEKSFGRVYAAFYLAAMTGILYSLFAYLRIFFTDEQALVGALVPAATMPMALRSYDYAPYSQLEPIFFAVGLILMYRRRHVWLGLLIALATINRETGIFLVLLFMVVLPLTLKRLRIGAVYLMIWAATYFGLRWVIPAGPPRYWTLDTVWYGNTHEWNQILISLVNVALLYGAFWIFALLGLPRAPRFVRRSAIIAPPYIVTVGAWGVWTEVRLLQPLYPIIVPLALSFLFAPRGAPTAVSGVLDESRQT